jgi:hypothetical protein
VLFGAMVLQLLFMVATAAGEPANTAGTSPAPSAAAMAEYHRLLAAYLGARAAYEADTKAYWSSIAQKRGLRLSNHASGTPIVLDDYVLTQPPVYTGPPQPVNPAAPKTPTPKVYVPVVADFLNAATQEYGFVPQQPQNDLDFKRAYANVALAAGLTKNQIVRVYSFEATGNGTYNMQAGLEYNTPAAHAVTTALGYNQLLNTNSVELMAEAGDQFLEKLKAEAVQQTGGRQQALLNKMTIVQRMVDYASSVPDDWGQHEVLANTPKGLAIHAMNLDIDVGPMLQTEKLLMSVLFARRHGYLAELTAAELEMMNLTGDGSGFEIVTMPQEWRLEVPTSNFFQPWGYENNPVAQRNNVVAKLIAATDAVMDEESKKQGAKDLAAACGP